MISTTGRAVSYTADGVQTVFAFPHALIDASHLSAVLDGVTLTAYNVVLNSNSDTGAEVTFTTAPTANGTLVLSRNTPITQLVDYTPGDAFNAETHENALDKLTLILQEYQDDLGRAIRAPIGSTGQTRVTTSFYGKYLGFNATGDVVALEETVGSGTGSSFDLANASDVDIINVSAAGTTDIAIPDTETPIFGAVITASAGSGTYSHNVRLPAPASTGQRAFIRIKYATAHAASITIQDNASVGLFQTSGQRGQYNSNIEVVANGSSWVLANIKRGDIGADQFQGATYIIPADPSDVPTATELATAAADVNAATIYIDNSVSFEIGDFVNIPSRHRLVFGQNAGLNFLNGFFNGGCGCRIDCEVVTASKDQPIFLDAAPGTVFGKFGGQPRSASWWGFRSTLPSIAFPDNWNDIQSALSSADWTAAGTPVTITNWNDVTGVVTVADTSEFAEGDVVLLTGTLGSGLVASRPYVVVSAVSGAGTTLSTFRLAQAYGMDALTFGTGGSLAATVTKAKSSESFQALLTGTSYDVDRPLDWAGSGAVLVGKNATITAIAGEWASRVEEVETFAADHSPMLLLGETGATAWSSIPCGVEAVTLNGGSISGVSGVGSRGHIPQRSFVRDISMTAISRHFVGWAKAWSARIGQAAANDTSSIDVSNFTFGGMVDNTGIPLHLPGFRSQLLNGSVAGNGASTILYGANQKGVSVRDVSWSGAYSLVDLIDDALYLNVHLDNAAGEADPQDTISVTSVDTGTNVLTAVGHNFANGDILRHTGVGTAPTGWNSANAYVVISATTDTFQVADAPGQTAFSMSADNGAFTVERPGVIVQFKSTQATAKVTAVSMAALANEVVLVDTAAHNKIVTAGDDRAIDGPRRADFLAWSSVGYSVIADGIQRVRGLVLYDVDNQYELPSKGDEIVLMSLNTTGNDRSIVFKAEDEGGSTKRWKYLDMDNANTSFTAVTADPEV